jgi:hypothetical protein
LLASADSDYVAGAGVATGGGVYAMAAATSEDAPADE